MTWVIDKTGIGNSYALMLCKPQMSVFSRIVCHKHCISQTQRKHQQSAIDNAWSVTNYRSNFVLLIPWSFSKLNNDGATYLPQRLPDGVHYSAIFMVDDQLDQDFHQRWPGTHQFPDCWFVVDKTNAKLWNDYTLLLDSASLGPVFGDIP